MEVKTKKCAVCNGTGIAPISTTTNPPKCKACDGTGIIQTVEFGNTHSKN